MCVRAFPIFFSNNWIVFKWTCRTNEQRKAFILAQNIWDSESSTTRYSFILCLLTMVFWVDIWIEVCLKLTGRMDKWRFWFCYRSNLGLIIPNKLLMHYYHIHYITKWLSWITRGKLIKGHPWYQYFLIWKSI